MTDSGDRDTEAGPFAAPDAAAIPAATLIVLRPRTGGAPDILMLERSARMAFAAGALVFPGGRIEPSDGADDDAAARVAAIRETIEEAGVAIGIAPPPDAATIAGWRAALAAGASLAELAAAAGARIDPAALRPYARWRPAHRLTRVFDTRFYLATWPAEAPPPSVDATENARLFWATAAETLAAIAAGRARAIFPTRCVLERLARFDDVVAIQADAAAWPIRTIVPRIETIDGTRHVVIPGDIGYPFTAMAVDVGGRE